MRYLLLIYGDESHYANMSEEELQADMQNWWEYTSALKEAGASPGGEALQSTATATTVRDDNGSPLVTDGPFAETREQLGGYFLVEARDLDEALAIAERIPIAKRGTIEVRPVVELPGMPE
jgi:hypothetical protein